MAQRYSVILTASNSQVRVQLLASFSGSFPYSGESGQQPCFTQAVCQAYSHLQRASHCPAFPQLPLGSTPGTLSPSAHCFDYSCVLTEKSKNMAGISYLHVYVPNQFFESNVKTQSG